MSYFPDSSLPFRFSSLEIVRVVASSFWSKLAKIEPLYWMTLFFSVFFF